MTMPHHCLACAADLTRIRATIDDALALPLVACPACGLVQARRFLRLRRRWRRVSRAACGVGIVLLQLLLLGLATALTLNGAMLMESTVRDVAVGRAPSLTRLLDDLGLRDFPALAIFIPMAMFALPGLWHGLSFAHLRPGRALLGFVAWLAAVLLVAIVAEALAGNRLPTADDWTSLRDAAVGLGEGALPFVLGMMLGRRARRDARRRGLERRDRLRTRLRRSHAVRA